MLAIGQIQKKWWPNFSINSIFSSPFLERNIFFLPEIQLSHAQLQMDFWHQGKILKNLMIEFQKMSRQTDGWTNRWRDEKTLFDGTLLATTLGSKSKEKYKVSNLWKKQLHQTWMNKWHRSTLCYFTGPQIKLYEPIN